MFVVSIVIDIRCGHYCPNQKVGFHPTFSALGRASKLPLLSLNENVLKSAISRQAKASKLSLVLWLNEIVALTYAIPSSSISKMRVEPPGMPGCENLP